MLTSREGKATMEPLDNLTKGTMIQTLKSMFYNLITFNIQ